MATIIPLQRRGEWDVEATYNPGDMVVYRDNTYVCAETTAGDTQFELDKFAMLNSELASLLLLATGPAGAPGRSAYQVWLDAGNTGTVQDYLDSLASVEAGPSNVLTVGTVSTGPAGSSASAQITGTSPNQVISFTIPRGATGAAGVNGVDGVDGTDGQDGLDGLPGESAYELALETGFVGTLEEWLDSLVGPEGAASTVPGPANQLTVGTVSTLEPGQDATVSITGTSPSQTVNFGIPRGADGSGGGSGLPYPLEGVPDNDDIIVFKAGNAGGAGAYLDVTFEFPKDIGPGLIALYDPEGSFDQELASFEAGEVISNSADLMAAFNSFPGDEHISYAWTGDTVRITVDNLAALGVTGLAMIGVGEAGIVSFAPDEDGAFTDTTVEPTVDRFVYEPNAGGTPGPANNITVGDVEVVPGLPEPEVYMTGTTPAQEINFRFPIFNVDDLEFSSLDDFVDVNINEYPEDTSLRQGDALTSTSRKVVGPSTLNIPDTVTNPTLNLTVNGVVNAGGETHIDGEASREVTLQLSDYATAEEYVNAVVELINELITESYYEANSVADSNTKLVWESLWGNTPLNLRVSAGTVTSAPYPLTVITGVTTAILINLKDDTDTLIAPPVETVPAPRVFSPAPDTVSQVLEDRHEYREYPVRPGYSYPDLVPAPVTTRSDWVHGHVMADPGQPRGKGDRYLRGDRTHPVTGATVLGVNRSSSRAWLPAYPASWLPVNTASREFSFDLYPKRFYTGLHPSVPVRVTVPAVQPTTPVPDSDDLVVSPSDARAAVRTAIEDAVGSETAAAIEAATGFSGVDGLEYTVGGITPNDFGLYDGWEDTAAETFVRLQQTITASQDLSFSNPNLGSVIQLVKPEPRVMVSELEPLPAVFEFTTAELSIVDYSEQHTYTPSSPVRVARVDFGSDEAYRSAVYSAVFTAVNVLKGQLSEATVESLGSADPLHVEPDLVFTTSVYSEVVLGFLNEAGRTRVMVPSADPAEYVFDILPNPTAEPGPPGQPGPAGLPNSLTVGAVEPVASDEDPEVTITGVPPNQVIDFKLPKGVFTEYKDVVGWQGIKETWYNNLLTWDTRNPPREYSRTPYVKSLYDPFVESAAVGVAGPSAYYAAYSFDLVPAYDYPASPVRNQLPVSAGSPIRVNVPELVTGPDATGYEIIEHLVRSIAATLVPEVVDFYATAWGSQSNFDDAGTVTYQPMEYVLKNVSANDSGVPENWLFRGRQDIVRQEARLDESKDVNIFSTPNIGDVLTVTAPDGNTAVVVFPDSLTFDKVDGSLELPGPPFTSSFIWGMGTQTTFNVTDYETDESSTDVYKYLVDVADAINQLLVDSYNTVGDEWYKSSLNNNPEGLKFEHPDVWTTSYELKLNNASYRNVNFTVRDTTNSIMLTVFAGAPYWTNYGVAPALIESNQVYQNYPEGAGNSGTLDQLTQFMPRYVGFTTDGTSFPGTRPDGSALQAGDRVTRRNAAPGQPCEWQYTGTVWRAISGLASS